MKKPQQPVHFINRYFGIENKAGLNNQISGGYILRELTARSDALHPSHAAPILAASFKRHLAALIPLLATDRGINAGVIDGYWGPQTQYAFDTFERRDHYLQHKAAPQTQYAFDTLLFLEKYGALPDSWRDGQLLDLNPNGWPIERQAELEAFYGQPGDESTLTFVDVPYMHRLSWDLRQKVTRIRCHKKVANSLRKVLGEVLNHYSMQQIQDLNLDRFGDCFNLRKKRGGTLWSTHSWGIALDYDPNRNQLNWGWDRAAFAGPDYSAWWKIWESEGWVSLGRTANFDWMHIQAAKRP
jgi:hypothetical protein